MSTTTSNVPISSPYITLEEDIEQALPVGRKQQAFPVKTFKVFGAVQICLGVLLGILSLIGVILDIITWNKYNDCFANFDNDFFNDRYFEFIRICSRYDHAGILLAFDITCLLCSGWCVFTGCLPMCMSKKREARWVCLKIGFMVCCIIGAAFFVPTMFSLGVVGVLLRLDSKAVILSVFMIVVSLTEVVVAILAASYCCCCSPRRTSNQQGVVIGQTTQPGMFLYPPQTHIPMQNGHQVVIASGQSTYPIVQYHRGQEHQVMTTTQPTEQQVQAVGGKQPEPNGWEVFDNNPPGCKE
ncbi:uncharacterized protein LOC143078105 [Mytilus galloprovincialis]|uniref:uncharacterized protein LOC143078105 n=1 Tax=Mytilus galloprovincialis TaxID=29158 RepID=UPI003F7BAC0C